MVKICLDTVVIVDILTKRDPHYESSVKLIKMALENQVEIAITKVSVQTIIYLVFEVYKVSNANEIILKFLKSVELLDSDKSTFFNAIQSTFSDKEDALQYFTALENDCQYFITRKLKDYKKHESTVPVYDPNGFYEYWN